MEGQLKVMVPPGSGSPLSGDTILGCGQAHVRCSQQLSAIAAQQPSRRSGAASAPYADRRCRRQLFVCHGELSGSRRRLYRNAAGTEHDTWPNSYCACDVCLPASVGSQFSWTEFKVENVRHVLCRGWDARVDLPGHRVEYDST